MKCEPQYVSRSQRSREAWAKTAAKLRIPSDVAREVYLSRFCTGIDSRDFHQLVERGEFTRKIVMDGQTVKEVQDKIAAREADRIAKKRPSLTDEDLDNGDRLNFEVKGVLEIGDEWESDETKTYCFSSGEYITKGKRYEITGFKDEGFGSFTIVTKTNFPAPDDRHWVSSHGVRRVFRAGKLIWDRKAAWIRDWTARHPEQAYPAEPDDLALFAALGWPTPPKPSPKPEI